MAGGIHKHTSVDRDRMVTSLDGEHTHTFELPDGTMVESEPGGAHSHVLDSSKASTTFGGMHAHKVKLPGMADDEYVMTDIDGWHNHELDTKEATEGGIHQHMLWSHDGVSYSLLPGEMKKGKRFRHKKSTPRPISEDMLDASTNAAIATLKSLAAEHVPGPPAPPVKKEDTEDDWDWANADDLSSTVMKEVE